MTSSVVAGRAALYLRRRPDTHKRLMLGRTAAWQRFAAWLVQ